MDCKNVVAVNDKTNYSSQLEDAAVLIRQELCIECPLIHCTALNSYPDAELFLLPYFEGETFELVCALGKPIIGPAAMIFLIKSQILLPRRLKNGQHIYSLSLHGAKVCCSNIDKESREKLYGQVTAMGGSCSTHLTSDVTHLVVSEVGSQKYQYAVKLGIPIMAPDWITTLWDMSKTNVVKNDQALMDKFKCAPFRGCTICVTGLDIAQRSDVEQLTVRHGGKYSGDLDMEKCTHLLADSTRSQKYMYAMKWKIPCVRSRWLYDSIERGVCLDIKDYVLTESKENCSSSNGEASYLTKPVLEETRQGHEFTRRLSELDVTANKDKGYLDGCRIYLSGFNTVEQDQLKKLINNGGGLRLDVVSPRVTHIVTKNCSLKETSHPDAAVVSAQWLIECMEKGALQAEEKYMFLPPTSNDPKDPLPNFRPSQVRQEDTSAILDQYKCDVTVKSNDVTMTTGDVTVAPNNTVTGDITSAERTESRLDVTAEIINKTLFEKCAFYVCQNIPYKIARNVQWQIVQHGGVCRMEDVDFCVVDPFHEAPDQCPDKTHVTYMWIQRCIQSNKLLSLTDCVLFTPRHVPEECTVLQNTVICTTKFSGFELSHICKVIETMGGQWQGILTNKVIKNSKKTPDSLPCTHLIYKYQEKFSGKLKFARKSSIPCIPVEWLYSCLTSLSKLDTTPFEDESEKRKIVKRQHTKIADAAQTIVKEIKTSEVGAVTVLPCGNTLLHDKEGFLTPLKPRNKLKVDDVITALESPACTTDTRASSLSAVAYKKSLAHAMKRTAPPTKLLGGVVLVIKQNNKTIEVPVAEVKAAAKRNGAIVKTYIDRTCTHVVCGQKEMKETTMESAVKQGVKLVSCFWVLISDEQQIRLPEADFPPGVDPKRSLNMSVSEDVTLPTVDIDNTQPVEGDPSAELSENNTYSLDPTLQKEIKMMEKLPSSEHSSGFVAPGTPRSRQPNKRSTARRIQPTSLPVPESSQFTTLAVTYDGDDAAREAFLARQEAEDKQGSSPVHNTDKAPSTPRPNDTLNNSSVPVGGPTSASTPNQSTKAVAKLSDEELQELIKDIDVDDLTLSDVTEEEKTKETGNVLVEKRERYFMLTGIKETEKQECGDAINELGGVHLTSSTFDPKCTHLIARSPNRNEKYLAGMGCGVWLLHPSYLSASRAQGAWLPEEPYLWVHFASSLRGYNKALASASALWQGRQAFTGWNVMLCAGSKAVTFKGIIECGGGKVVQSGPPYAVLSHITHALIDPSEKTSTTVPMDALEEAGVPLLKLEYIPDYLTMGATQEVLDKCRISGLSCSAKRTRESSNETVAAKRSKT